MNKKRWIIFSIIFLMLAGIWMSAEKIHEIYVKSQLEPLTELKESANNMLALKSYRYELKSGFTVEQREEVISNVSGEKEAGKTHIKGEMVNTEIDIYYIDRTIYNYDSLSDKWLVIESSTNSSEELLISELNPLSNFSFKQVDAAEKIGFEKVDGRECLVVKCQPDIESKLLETLWQNFEYQMWIDYQDKIVRKAVLSAVNQRSPTTVLKIEAHFYDFDERISIDPPDTTVKKK
ncbi:MAG TPA: hypothetical protein PKV15_04075 [Syntrophomonadaceae bacterium]|nr:hypothetical protein [Syntrophomonadaceae bacterium]HRX20605.1 hypothetical protein [Syntrophomonadaceae bacterium]